MNILNNLEIDISIRNCNIFIKFNHKINEKTKTQNNIYFIFRYNE